MTKKAKGKAKQRMAMAAGKESVKAKSARWSSEGKAMIREGKEKMADAVKKMEQAIRHQSAENRVAAKKMEAAVKKMIGDTDELKSEYKAAQQEMGQYAKQFNG